MDNTSNLIVEVLKRLEKTGKKAFIPYVTAGDPTIEKTSELLGLFAKHGADIIELGVPFSDPMADGPVIQRAMERALKSGTTLAKVLCVVRKFKEHHPVPIVLMGYYNPFWAYGIERFAKDAKNSGVDAVLTVDLPPEEARAFTNLLRKKGIISIFLATPVTDTKRIEAIRKIARGFIYFVSVTGVTGERSVLSDEIKVKIDEIKDKTGLPVVLGFGISGSDIMKRFYPHVDGFVVGSALVKRWEEAFSSREKLEAFWVFFKELVETCHNWV